MKPPPGYRFDPFADVRMGLSLFQMRGEDWLVRDDRPAAIHAPATLQPKDLPDDRTG